MRHVIGVDISTQTIRAMLIGVLEEDGRPKELVVSGAWMESRPCKDDLGRKNPDLWVDLVRECIDGLKLKAREAETAEAIGISTTFPGCFIILRDGSVDPRFVRLYDNPDDADICGGAFEDGLGEAELDTVNRMWPGNMAIGLASIVKAGCNLADAAKIVPPNTAFAWGLLKRIGAAARPTDLFSDLTQTAISGLYSAYTGEPLPSRVRNLIRTVLPGVSQDQLRSLLPAAVPSWRSVLPADAVAGAQEFLGLPQLRSVSIGAGDSPLGALALMCDRDTVINVRGSSDSPMIVVDAPKPRTDPRETVLHYPMPTAVRMDDSPWCIVAPMLRSGRVWDWVRGLRFADGEPDADLKLEEMALEAMRSGRQALEFDTALGGERAPEWDPYAVGKIAGLVEAHTIGDIALAALLDMTQKLQACIRLMEGRYSVKTRKMLVVGGPAKNKLWNGITQAGTGKTTFATTFSDASLLGAALLGYATAYDGVEPDTSVSQRLLEVSRLSSSHPLVAPVPVEPLH